MPANNSTNIPVVVYPPSALGTWTVTFADATHGSLSGPGITTTNFTLPDEAVASNFSPATSFVQFGCFKNDGANDGHNNDATGTFGHVMITGSAAPIDDDFSGAALTNNYAWRQTSANEVQYVAPGTAWFLSWSAPAFGFKPFVASSLAGPWNTLAGSPYQNGTNIYVAALTNALPAGGKAFFRVANYPFVKLQVFCRARRTRPARSPARSARRSPQTVGVPFDLTINACDAVWDIVSASDTVAITSDDVSAWVPPNTALVNGTVTILGNTYFGSSGTWTITATDVTTNAISAGTSTPITIP